MPHNYKPILHGIYKHILLTARKIDGKRELIDKPFEIITNAGSEHGRLWRSVGVRKVLYSSDVKRRASVELKAEIEARITGEPTMVWTPVDFLDLGSRAAVDKALQRLTKEGALSRISRGLIRRASSLMASRPEQ
jgi:hypothetical protein